MSLLGIVLGVSCAIAVMQIFSEDLFSVCAQSMGSNYCWQEYWQEPAKSHVRWRTYAWEKRKHSCGDLCIKYPHMGRNQLCKTHYQLLLAVLMGKDLCRTQTQQEYIPYFIISLSMQLGMNPRQQVL